MIDVKEATEIAADYLKKLKQVYSIALEEVELSEDEKYWFVTLSYRTNDIFTPVSSKYKVFKIDSQRGKVLSMKIRE